MVVCRGRHRDVDFDSRDVVHIIGECYLDRLAIGYHFVAEIPTRTTGQLGHDNIAIAKKVNVKVDMVDGISGDVYLRYVSRQEVGYLGDRGDLHARTHDNNQVHLVFVHVFQPVEEVVGECFAKEGNVWLHDAGLRNVKGAIRLRVFVAGSLLSAAVAVRGPLALPGGLCGNLFLAALALGRSLCAHIVENFLARHLELALPARCSCPGTVALDKLLLAYSRICLNVIDVLGIVGEELVLILQQAYELVRGRPLLEVGYNVASQRIKGARVLVKVVNIKDFLGLVVAHLQQSRVEARVLGAEVGYAQAGRDARTGDDHDALALLQQLGSVFNGLVLVKAGALVELAIDGQAEQLVEVLVGGFFEELGYLDAKRRAQLARRHLLAGDVLHNELAGADLVQSLAQSTRLVGGTHVYTWAAVNRRRPRRLLGQTHRRWSIQRPRPRPKSPRTARPSPTRHHPRRRARAQARPLLWVWSRPPPSVPPCRPGRAAERSPGRRRVPLRRGQPWC